MSLKSRLQDILTELWLVDEIPTHSLINELSAFLDGVDNSENVYNHPLLATLTQEGYEWLVDEIQDLLPHLSLELKGLEPTK